MEHTTQITKKTIYDFLPLIIIVSFIIVLTLIKQWYQGFSIDGAMIDFMSFFFLIFGGFKLLKWSSFVEAYKEYDLIAKTSTLYAYAYPLIEISLGIAYFFRWQLPTVNVITFIIMTVSAIGVAKELLANRQITCACLGVVFKIPMTWVTFAEDLLMAGMAFIMIIW